MRKLGSNYYDKSFWIEENSIYIPANFRMRKCARFLNQQINDRPRDLLDLGCGPATLRQILDPNFNYHGIDIALHYEAPYLIEDDFVAQKVSFRDKRFDVVVALGVFEYMGSHQDEKFEEIRDLMNEGGTFIMSYINFDHFRSIIYPIYNNVQRIQEMKHALSHYFDVQKVFPSSHHWRHKQPGKNALPRLQMHFSTHVPLLSTKLAVEYFFVCSPRK